MWSTYLRITLALTCRPGNDEDNRFLSFCVLSSLLPSPSLHPTHYQGLSPGCVCVCTFVVLISPLRSSSVTSERMSALLWSAGLSRCLTPLRCLIIVHFMNPGQVPARAFSAAPHIRLWGHKKLGIGMYAIFGACVVGHVWWGILTWAAVPLPWQSRTILTTTQAQTAEGLRGGGYHSPGNSHAGRASSPKRSSRRGPEGKHFYVRCPPRGSCKSNQEREAPLWQPLVRAVAGWVVLRDG